MTGNYPRYPVDFYRLRVVLPLPAPPSREPSRIIVDVVRENPFGTAFLK